MSLLLLFLLVVFWFTYKQIKIFDEREYDKAGSFAGFLNLYNSLFENDDDCSQQQ